jgi:hypothetical protein
LTCCQTSIGCSPAWNRAPGGAAASRHAQVVELDALALGALLAVPVGGSKRCLASALVAAEQPVVAVEAVKHRLAMS